MNTVIKKILPVRSLVARGPPPGDASHLEVQQWGVHILDLPLCLYSLKTFSVQIILVEVSI